MNIKVNIKHLKNFYKLNHIQHLFCSSLFKYTTFTLWVSLASNKCFPKSKIHNIYGSIEVE